MNILKRMVSTLAIVSMSAILLHPCISGITNALTSEATLTAYAEYDFTSVYSDGENYTTDCIMNGYVDLETGERDEYSLHSQTLNRDYAWLLLAERVQQNENLTDVSKLYKYLTDYIDTSPFQLQLKV